MDKQGQVRGWIRARLPQTWGANDLLVFGQAEQHWVGEGSPQTLKPRLPSGKGGASASPAHLCFVFLTVDLLYVCVSSPRINAFLRLLTLLCLRPLPDAPVTPEILPAFKFPHWQRKHTHPRSQTVAHVLPMEQKSTSLIHRKFQPPLNALPFSGPSYHTRS